MLVLRVIDVGGPRLKLCYVSPPMEIMKRLAELDWPREERVRITSTFVGKEYFMALDLW